MQRLAGAQPDGAELFDVRLGQPAERVAAQHPARGDLGPEGAAVAADVPHVHGTLERQEPTVHLASIFPGQATQKLISLLTGTHPYSKATSGRPSQRFGQRSD